MLYATSLTYSKTLESQLDTINNRNKADIMNKVQQLNDKINSLTDYDELVSVVPAKMLLKMAAQRIGLASDKDYVDLLVKYLQQDSAFNALVKSLLNINFSTI